MLSRLEHVWGPGDGRPVEELKVAIDQVSFLSQSSDSANSSVHHLFTVGRECNAEASILEARVTSHRQSSTHCACRVPPCPSKLFSCISLCCGVVQQLLVEYLLSRQQDEAAACVKELDCSLFHHEIVKRAVKVHLSCLKVVCRDRKENKRKKEQRSMIPLLGR